MRTSVAWMQALQRRDAVALDSLIAPEYRLSSPGGASGGVDKATWIRNAMTIIRTDSAAYRSMSIRSVGPDLAVGSGQLYWKARLRGWPIPSSFAVTDVWVRRDGRWQVAARDGGFTPKLVASLGAMVGAALVGLVWIIAALGTRRRRRRAARDRSGVLAGAANSVGRA